MTMVNFCNCNDMDTLYFQAANSKKKAIELWYIFTLYLLQYKFNCVFIDSTCNCKNGQKCSSETGQYVCSSGFYGSKCEKLNCIYKNLS